MFADKELTLLSARVLGKNQNVLRMRIRSSYGAVMDAIYFGDIQEFKEYTADQFSQKAVDELFRGTETSGIVMSFVYYPEINSFHGTESLQIVVKNYC